MTFVEGIVDRLVALSSRARTADEKADLTPAIALVSDLGSLITRGEEREIKSAQSAVAALRDALASDQSRRNAAEALRDENYKDFLAGAMWAISELMTGRLDAIDAQRALPRRRTRKAAVEKLCLDALTVDSGLTPTEIQRSHDSRELDVKPYELSRVLGDLLGRGLIQTVAPPHGADRRNRHFALTDNGRLHVTDPAGTDPR